MPSRPDRPGQPFLRPAAKAALELLLVTAALVLLALALVRLRFVVLPVVIALFASTALWPVCRRLLRTGMPRALAALLTILTGFALLVVVVAVLIPPFVDQIGDVGDTARDGIDEIGRWLEDGPVHADQDDIDEAVDEGLQNLRDNAGGIGRGVVTGATLALEIVAGLLVALVLTFFFLLDGPRIWAWVLSFVPARLRDDVDGFGNDALGVLGGYLRGVTIVATIDAVLIGLGLAVLGVPLVVPLAVLTFLAAFIPLAGAITAGAVAALVALVTQGVVDAILVVVLVTLVQQVEGDLLYPLIMRRAIELHPVATLLSVLTGGVLYGIIGAALALPLAAVAWTGIKRWRAHRAAAAEPEPTPEGAVLLDPDGAS